METAFLWASMGAVGASGGTHRVRAAIDDALALTIEEFDGPDVDRRTDVVTTFYRHVGSFHCAYWQAAE